MFFLGYPQSLHTQAGKESKEQDFTEGEKPKGTCGWEDWGCLQGLEELVLPPASHNKTKGLGSNRQEEREPLSKTGVVWVSTRAGNARGSRVAWCCVPKEPPGPSPVSSPPAKGFVTEQRMNESLILPVPSSSIPLPASPCRLQTGSCCLDLGLLLQEGLGGTRVGLCTVTPCTVFQALNTLLRDFN